MSDAYGADPNAPLVPGNTPQPDVNQQAQTGGLADSWRSWMADPHNRAAMIQFGVSLSQPIGAGQNALGHIGSAFGQAGEASDRITAEEDKQQELESKQGLRESQAQLAGARAETAGTVASARLQALEFQKQKLAMTGDVAGLRALTAIQQMYMKEHAVWQKNKGFGLEAGPEPTIEGIMMRNPGLASQIRQVSPGSGGGAPGGGGDLIAQARDAIAKGANRAAVIDRLKQQGVDPSGL